MSKVVAWHWAMEWMNEWLQSSDNLLLIQLISFLGDWYQHCKKNLWEDTKATLTFHYFLENMYRLAKKFLQVFLKDVAEGLPWWESAHLVVKSHMVMWLFQWLTARLAMQWTLVWSLIREEPPCWVRTKPLHHSHWCLAPGACVLQQEKPLQGKAHTPQRKAGPTCCSKRKPVHSRKTQHSQK